MFLCPFRFMFICHGILVDDNGNLRIISFLQVG